MIKVIENKKQCKDKLKQNIVLAFTGIIDDIYKMPYKTVTTDCCSMFIMIAAFQIGVQSRMSGKDGAHPFASGL